jgi:hypothetical protein
MQNSIKFEFELLTEKILTIEEFIKKKKKRSILSCRKDVNETVLIGHYNQVYLPEMYNSIETKLIEDAKNQAGIIISAALERQNNELYNINSQFLNPS